MTALESSHLSLWISRSIVWTSYYLSLLIALLHDTLQHPRWNWYVILVTRCVLLYSYRNVDVPVTNNLVTCPARRWRTSRCMSGIPRVYLSIVGVAISHNYSIQNIGILSGKHEGHLYDHPVTRRRLMITKCPSYISYSHNLMVMRIRLLCFIYLAIWTIVTWSIASSYLGDSPHIILLMIWPRC